MSLLTGVAERLDRRFGWDKLPLPLGAADPDRPAQPPARAEPLRHRPRPARPARCPDHPRYLTARTLDGTFNDLDDPLMGSLGSRFGRNVPLDRDGTRAGGEAARAEPASRQPGAADARRVLARDDAQPARRRVDPVRGPRLVQPRQERAGQPVLIPLADDDPWPAHPMEIMRTRPDPSASDNGAPTFVTDDTHWWDGSQIYGRDGAFADGLRSGEHGKLRIDEHGLPPQDLEAHVDLTGVAGNFWVGLALLHSLFMREHNAFCDHLHERIPTWSDDELYDKARLVVAALMAKIHTVDWTPAIIAHPTTVLALRTNWWGLEGERLDKLFGRRTSNEVIRGIPGSPTAHHGVPYSLTEEFVAVYRMHPLIPDEFSFRSLADDAMLQERTLPELGAVHVRARLDEMSMPDLLYSFGTSHPGAITLHNFPRFLQRFDRPDGSLIDLAAIDVLRIARARRSALQRVPAAAPSQSLRAVRGDGGHAGARRGTAADLRRRRACRHDDRDVRGAEAEGLRVQRHRVPHLHPHGLAPPRERPLLHAGLPARGLHAEGHRLGRDARRCAPCSFATSPRWSRRCAASRTRSRPGRPLLARSLSPTR